MSSNKFIGCNIFFRFKKLNQNGLYNTKVYTRIIPINKLRYIDYCHYTNKTYFYFDDCSVESIPENKDFDVIKSIEQQINNGFNIIDIKED